MSGKLRIREIIFLAAVFLLVFAVAGATMFPLEKQYVEDINGDGFVNVTDVIFLLAAGRRNPKAQIADYNGDGEFSVSDAIALLLNIMHGELTPLPQEPPRFYDLLLSNHTGTAFVLSWRTSRETKLNQVHFGYDPHNLDQVRGDTLVAVPGKIHYVQLIRLEPGRTVYYKVVSDNGEYSSSPGDVDSVLTFDQRLPPASLILSGWVTDSRGAPLPGILVRTCLRSEADSSMWFTVVSDEEGGFSVETGNYRTAEGNTLPYSPGKFSLHLELLGETGKTVGENILLQALPGEVQDLGALTFP